MAEMKTAISLPDELFHAVDAKARALKLTRSGLLALAARELIARREKVSDATDAWIARSRVRANLAMKQRPRCFERAASES